MNPDAAIADAVRRGRVEGPASLGRTDRVLALIGEAEWDCDREGIDALLERFSKARLTACADAFSAVGAAAIARSLQKVIARLPDRPERLLDDADELIKAREGYDAETLQAFIDRPQPTEADPTTGQPPIDTDPLTDPPTDLTP